MSSDRNELSQTFGNRDTFGDKQTTQVETNITEDQFEDADQNKLVVDQASNYSNDS